MPNLKAHALTVLSSESEKRVSSPSVSARLSPITEFSWALNVTKCFSSVLGSALFVVAQTYSREMRVICRSKEGSCTLTLGVIAFYVVSGANIWRSSLLKSMLGVWLRFIAIY